MSDQGVPDRRPEDDAAAKPERRLKRVVAGNHDIHVLPSYAASAPRVQAVLQDPRVATLFDELDSNAKTAKRLFHLFGVGSLALTIIALEGEVATLALEAAGTRVPWWVHLLIRGLGAVAFVIITLNRWFSFRLKWCYAVFLRERLRQWRHELLLDGEFLDKLKSDHDGAEEYLSRRWAEFEYLRQTVDGAFNRFVTAGSLPEDLFQHPLKPPQNSDLLGEVLNVQHHLRLSYQAGYARAKLAEEARGGVTILNWSTWSEWVVSTSLFFAVIVTMAAFVMTLFHLSSEDGLITLSAVAVGLGLLSAGARVFRVGMTIPEESDSYHTYAEQVLDLEIAFNEPDVSPSTQYQHLISLEEASIDELRRFLAMKRMATFVF